jgi:hypothetical protein
MTKAEIEALNAGANAVLDLARLTAAAFRRHPTCKPTRSEYAAVALEELAEAGKELLLETSVRAGEASR